MIEVKKIAHSIGPYHDKEIATLQIRYPRFIHSEFMTHRVFSRNASSSRAIPIKKMIDDIKANIAYPEYWGKHQPGMQAKEELGEDAIRESRSVWEDAMFDAVLHAERLMRLGNHKQVVNRLLEPFAHIAVIVTSTEWENFFALRCHVDAQPEIKILAEMMQETLKDSTPEFKHYNDWHLPYIQENEFNLKDARDIELALKCSTARCCRVSYLNHDGTEPNIEKDLKTYDKLVASVPMHASPLEHQAVPDWAHGGNYASGGNLQGWIQYRKIVENFNYNLITRR